MWQRATRPRYVPSCVAPLSGADIEAVRIRARMKSALENDAAVDVDDLKAAMEDFIPPSYPTEIELQNLVAVLECPGDTSFWRDTAR